MKFRAPRAFRRLTYANVMSTLAVFLFISGGAAYAANTVFSADIVDGEVKAADIGNNQVTSTKIKNDTLTGGGLAAVDLAAGSVGSSEVTDGSVTADDLGTDSVAFSELAFGTLPNFTYQKQGSSATDTVVSKEVTVVCNNRAGDEVTGGGFVIAAGPSGGNVPNVQVARSYAVSANTWLVRAFATSGTPTWQLTATANCVG